ncbi:MULTISPECIES: FHA domain-containing protein [unclassified Pseudoclavibacter]|uniref:FHA domain-containing protein n=1 Tax=unclassified Pseudoclavibacter TaxID=2615177 RepID=UPI0011B0893F|nr:MULTISPECIES: FHA domain-containing protein [unclassified Pseudoclavibacter]MBF4551708.1 FHA domain-containing protein [Pseudoclavibacter sp. VKM Ac-2888]
MEHSGFIGVPPGLIGQGAIVPEAANTSGRPEWSPPSAANGGAQEAPADDWLRAELDDEYPLPPMPAPRPRLSPQQPSVPDHARAAHLPAAPSTSDQLAVPSAAPSAAPFGGTPQPGLSPESPAGLTGAAHASEARLEQPGHDAPGASAEQPLPEWVVVLADGVSVPIYGPVVIGRNPSQDRFPDASVSAVPDITQTMSKTHARFWADGERLYVDDLNSTNGVALFPGGNAHGALAVEPGVPAELRSGDVVQLGEYRLSIRRS